MKQKSKKSDNLDRRHVIKFVQKLCGVTLKRVGRRQKWLRDEAGSNWIFLVGTEGWHAIPIEVMDNLTKCPNDQGQLVIAHARSSGFDVFMGPLAPLVNEYASRPRHTEQFNFNCEIRKERMRIREAPKAELLLLGKVPFSEEDKQQEGRLRKFEKIVSGLSSDQRAELMEQLMNRCVERK